MPEGSDTFIIRYREYLEEFQDALDTLRAEEVDLYRWTMTMNLKLLGVLQDYGTPYASLYVNDKRDSLYLVIEQGRDGKDIFMALAIGVDCREIRRYLDGQIGLKSMVMESDTRLVWRRKKGAAGSFTRLADDRQLNEIADDDPFDPDFCTDMPLIMDNISHLAC